MQQRVEGVMGEEEKSWIAMVVMETLMTTMMETRF